MTKTFEQSGSAVAPTLAGDSLVNSDGLAQSLSGQLAPPPFLAPAPSIYVPAGPNGPEYIASVLNGVFKDTAVTTQQYTPSTPVQTSSSMYTANLNDGYYATSAISYSDPSSSQLAVKDQTVLAYGQPPDIDPVTGVPNSGKPTYQPWAQLNIPTNGGATTVSGPNGSPELTTSSLSDILSSVWNSITTWISDQFNAFGNFVNGIVLGLDPEGPGYHIVGPSSSATTSLSVPTHSTMAVGGSFGFARHDLGQSSPSMADIIRLSSH